MDRIRHNLNQRVENTLMLPGVGPKLFAEMEHDAFKGFNRLQQRK